MNKIIGFLGILGTGAIAYYFTKNNNKMERFPVPDGFNGYFDFLLDSKNKIIKIEQNNGLKFTVQKGKTQNLQFANKMTVNINNVGKSVLITILSQGKTKEVRNFNF